MKEAKRVSESAAEQVQLVLSSHINGYKRLFGGQLMAWIDMLGGVIARRHAEHEVTTACIDNLQFKKAVTINSTLVLKGKMTYVGRSSMEVRVDTFVERLDGTRELVNTCYMVLVALDENQKTGAGASADLRNSAGKRKNLKMGPAGQQLRKARRNEGY